MSPKGLRAGCGELGGTSVELTALRPNGDAGAFFIPWKPKNEREEPSCGGKLDEIRRSVQEQLLAAGDSAQVEQIRVSVLGRKGELTALLKGMGKLSPEERPIVGQQVNALRQEIEAALAQRKRS